MSMSIPAGPFLLSGIKVLDFSRILAAPLVSQIFGDLGAEVWKVEKPGSGDETRQWNKPSINGQSCYFLCVNRNKKSVALNLAHREGQELARRLSAKADVVLENFRTDQMHRFGLDYERLREANPGLIYCSLTGYGSTGPWAEDPGYDVVAEAVGGFLSITGPKSDGDSLHQPCKAGVAVVDALTGLYAHGAVLAALLARERTGSGRLVQVNLLATQIASLLNVGSNYLNAGLEGRPLGTEHESLVPYQAFQTRDGRHYVVGATNDEAFQELCTRMDLPREVSQSSDFCTLADRVANRDLLIGIFEKRFLEEDLDHWKRTLRTRRFPSGPLNTLREAFAHEQVSHLGLIKTVSHPVYGPVRLTRGPVDFEGGDKTKISNDGPFKAPPLLGEHTREVLTEELGLTGSELDRLKTDGAIHFSD